MLALGAEKRDGSLELRENIYVLGTTMIYAVHETVYNDFGGFVTLKGVTWYTVDTVDWIRNPVTCRLNHRCVSFHTVALMPFFFFNPECSFWNIIIEVRF